MNAEEFSNQSLSSGSLVYPPYYGKGKWGEYPNNVCFLPEQPGAVDYAYGSGVNVDFDFKNSLTAQVFVDGHAVCLFRSMDDVNEFFDNEEKTAFEMWVSELFEDSHELFETFFR